MIYSDSKLTFNKLLHKDNPFTTHERNIQALAIEIYNEANRYCSRFPFKSRYVNTVRYGTETISFLGPKIWSIIPIDMKNATTFEFKR